jgi:cytosine deaminase
MAGHLSPAEAYHAVSAASRTAMGLPVVDIVPNSPAELLAIAAPSLRAAIALASPARIVIHRGQVVAIQKLHNAGMPAVGTLA